MIAIGRAARFPALVVFRPFGRYAPNAAPRKAPELQPDARRHAAVTAARASFLNRNWRNRVV